MEKRPVVLLAVCGNCEGYGRVGEVWGCRPKNFAPLNGTNQACELHQIWRAAGAELGDIRFDVRTGRYWRG